MNLVEVKNFTKGLISAFEDHSIPDGSASSVQNWLTKGDHIELRRGLAVFGSVISGLGEVTGLHVATKVSGEQVLFRKRGRKLEYYTLASGVWTETGTEQRLVFRGPNGEELIISGSVIEGIGEFVEEFGAFVHGSG